MTRLPALARSAALSLRPGPNPLAIAAAARAVAAAAVIAGYGVIAGDLQGVAVAYLGAACAVAFVVGGPYSGRAAALAAQGVGAAIGISIGVLAPKDAAVMIVTAALVGAVSGVVGSAGRSAPGFGMMLSIGVAFGQFGGSALLWWQQAVWYLIGTSVVAVATLAPWVFRRGAIERETAAAVMTSAADLCELTGTADGRDARMRLASASMALRAARPLSAAQLVSFAASTMYADHESVPADAVAAIRTAAAQILAGEPVAVRYQAPPNSPGLRTLADALSPEPQRPAESHVRRLTAALRAVRTRRAAANAARLALCLAVATALTLALHEPAHSFWLPLTVAVIVRPEYASVFVRTVNRVCGSLAGAAVTAVLLTMHPSPLILAVAAAVGLGFAVLTAPKLYGLSVIGVTVSALLSTSIAGVDPVLPGLRMLDTLLGAAVAVVFGYLLWPGARRLPGEARLDAAMAAASAYLDEAVKPPAERVRWQSRRDDAYRLAHQTRAGAQIAAMEPPPVSSIALRVIPAAAELEDIVDEITAIAAARDIGGVDESRVVDIRRRLSMLGDVGR